MTAAVGNRSDHPLRDDPRLRQAGTAWLFGLFSTLLAASLILHQLWWNGLEVRSLHAVVIVAAVGVLVRPSSVVGFAIMLAAEVVAVTHDLPYVGDHTLVVFMIGLCVLGYLGWSLIRDRRLPGPADLFATIAPFLRASLIIVYAAAALSKLNTGFLDPQTSCAAPMSRKIIWFDPSLLSGTWQVTPAIWATVGIEIALPVLLAVPRTRVLGLILGCGFHVVLALAGNVPFSAVALALYVAFLPTHTVVGMHALVLRHRRLRAVARAVRTPTVSVAVFVGALAVWLLCAHVLPDHPTLRSHLIADGTRATIVVMVGVAGGLFLLSRNRTRVLQRYSGSARRLGHPIFVVGVALLLANAASPYLGLKSESTFTMFSNLRTEQGSWNHVLIPEAVRVFGFQDHPVTVVATDDRGLAAQAQAGTRFTRFEFDRYLRSHPRTSVTWTTADSGGPTTHIRGPVAGAAQRTLAEKLVHFKEIRPPENSDCG